MAFHSRIVTAYRDKGDYYGFTSFVCRPRVIALTITTIARMAAEAVAQIVMTEVQKVSIDPPRMRKTAPFEGSILVTPSPSSSFPGTT